jgi:hypothetical protein
MSEDKNLDLETKCSTCEGSRYLGTARCFECGGHGTVLTELGEKFLSLVARRLTLDEG